MKNVSAALALHLGDEVTTLATCWRLERTDGWVRGFTDHDRNLVIDGVTYVAATGFLPSAIKSGSDLSVDNLDVDGFLDDDALKAEDLTENSVLLGNSARITDTLKKVEAAGFSEVILYFNVGLKPHAQVKEEMDRFMREVAPNFQGKHQTRRAA